MSSDIHSILVGEVWRSAGMIAKASGNAITTGTVNYYLKALTGTNAGKWWKDLDQTWDVAETANAMTHQADGSWTITLAASPFTTGVLYLEYAKESGDLHVAGEGRLLRGIPSTDAVALTDAALQDIAQVTYLTDGTVWFVAPGGDDGNSGLTPTQAKLNPKTAAEAASARDSVAVCVGDFALGDAVINIPDGVNLFGSAYGVSRITSTAGQTTRGCIVRPGTKGMVRDLFISGLNAVGGTAQAGIGVYSPASDGQADFSDAVIRNVVATTNAIAFVLYADAGASWRVYDSFGQGSATAGYLHAYCTGDAHVHRSVFVGDGETPNAVRNVYGGTLRIYDCALLAIASGDIVDGITCTEGEVYAFNCCIYATSANQIFSIDATDGTVVASGCEYDRTQTNGDPVDVARVVTDTSGRAYADQRSILGTALTETAAGYLAAAFTTLFDVETPALVASDVMRGTDSAAPAATALSTDDWTNARAAYLDELAAANLPADVDAILADTGTDGVKLTAAERTSIADAVLARGVSNAEPSGDEHTLRFIILMMTESNTVDNEGSLTVYQTDGTTEVARKAVTTDADVEPITGIS